jgi:hypothetical protein
MNQAKHLAYIVSIMIYFNSLLSHFPPLDINTLIKQATANLNYLKAEIICIYLCFIKYLLTTNQTIKMFTKKEGVQIIYFDIVIFKNYMFLAILLASFI